jgi:hypothetical protein
MTERRWGRLVLPHTLPEDARPFQLLVVVMDGANRGKTHVGVNTDCFDSVFDDAKKFGESFGSFLAEIT